MRFVYRRLQKDDSSPSDTDKPPLAHKSRSAEIARQKWLVAAPNCVVSKRPPNLFDSLKTGRDAATRPIEGISKPLKASVNRDRPYKQPKLTGLKIGIQRSVVFKLTQH